MAMPMPKPASTSPAAPVAPAGPPVIVNTAGFPSGINETGIFTDNCKVALTAPNDPLAMPGMTGQSMQHDFFGNLAPHSGSTPASLLGGATNCTTSADASSYWTPVLYQNGAAVKASSTLIYWRAPSTTAKSVKTMPAGISILAGDKSATKPQDARAVVWGCTNDASGSRTNTPVNCPAGEQLRFIVIFPNCWDGHTLDGSAQTNVVYATKQGPCPSDHPVQVPQIVVHVNYTTSSAANLNFSIGPNQLGSVFTGHADFMNGWDQAAMDRNVAACIVTQTRCGSVVGAEATPKGGKVQG
jgi:hypothetical protein